VTAPSSNEGAAANSKLVDSISPSLYFLCLAAEVCFMTLDVFLCHLNKKAGGLDKLTLDSLYEDAIRVSQQQNRSYNPWEQNPVHNGHMMHQPFYASNGVAAPQPCQMANQNHQTFGYQHQNAGMMMGPVQQPYQQQQQNMNNPFGNPFVSNGNPQQPQGYNPYPRYM